MLREGMNHGFQEGAWAAAKKEARAVMVQYAKRERTIPYSELVSRISSIQLEAHDSRLFHFLGEIGEAEDGAGRGLLTAIVVHKNGDMIPGPGFFELAEACGRNTADIDRCWIDELKAIFAYWKSHSDQESVVRSPIGAFERLPIIIPEYPGSHPFSRGRAPKFYREEGLGDTDEGDTPRTQFFQKVLVGIYWAIGRPVPYAFVTRDEKTRSLDAGCVKFLLNRRPPALIIHTDAAGIIRAVAPTAGMLSTYTPMREALIALVLGEAPPLDLPFDLGAPVDERRRAESEIVIREGASEFRRSVLSVWGEKCAVTKTPVRAALDAAHIHRYLGSKTNDIRNGIALRADIHRLFDRYMLSIVLGSSGAVVRTSKLLHGTRYGKLDGAVVSLPKDVSHRPDRRVLGDHLRLFVEKEAKR